MNRICPTTSPLANPRICPFRIMCIDSYPAIVFRAPPTERNQRQAAIRFLMSIHPMNTAWQVVWDEEGNIAREPAPSGAEVILRAWRSDAPQCETAHRRTRQTDPLWPVRMMPRWMRLLVEPGTRTLDRPRLRDPAYSSYKVSLRRACCDKLAFPSVDLSIGLG